jgi:hypothetical protein
MTRRSKLKAHNSELIKEFLDRGSDLLNLIVSPNFFLRLRLNFA